MKMCLTLFSCLLLCSVVVGQEPAGDDAPATARAAAEAQVEAATPAAEAQVEAAADAQVQPVPDAAASQEGEVQIEPTPEPAANEDASDAAIVEPTQVAPIAEPTPLADPLTIGDNMIAPSADSISSACGCVGDVAQTSYEIQEVAYVQSCPTPRWQPGSLLRRVFRR